MDENDPLNEQYGVWWEFCEESLPILTHVLQEARRMHVARSDQPTTVVTSENEEGITIDLMIGSVKAVTLVCTKKLYDALDHTMSEQARSKEGELLMVIPSALKDWGEACRFKLLISMLPLLDLRTIEISYNDDCIILTYYLNTYFNIEGEPTALRNTLYVRLMEDNPHDVIEISQSMQRKLLGFIKHELDTVVRGHVAPILSSNLSKILLDTFGPNKNLGWEYGHYAHYVCQVSESRMGYRHLLVFSGYRDMTYQCVDLSLDITPVASIKDGLTAQPKHVDKPYSPIHNHLENFLDTNYVLWCILEHNEQHTCYHIQDNRGAITLDVRVGDANTFGKPEGMEEV